MIARITFVARPLWLKLVQPLAVWFYSDWIKDEESYITRLRAGGIYTPEMIAKREANLGPLRAMLAFWEAR